MHMIQSIFKDNTSHFLSGYQNKTKTLKKIERNSM